MTRYDKEFQTGTDEYEEAIRPLDKQESQQKARREESADAHDVSEDETRPV